MASTLYIYGKSKKNAVYIRFRDRFGIYQRKSTGFTIDNVVRRSGRITWPAYILRWKETFDSKLYEQRWDLKPKAARSICLTKALELTLQFKKGKLSHSTVRMYKLAMKKLVDHVGDVPVSLLEEADLVDFRIASVTKCGEQNTAAWLRHISPVFSHCVSSGYMSSNLITKNVRINPSCPPPNAYTMVELKLLFDYAEEHSDRYEGLANQCRYLILSGCRSQESCDLKWEAVRWERKCIQFFNEKAKRYESQPMDEIFERFMKSLPTSSKPFVFKYRQAEQLSARILQINRKLGHNAEYNVHTFKTNAIERWRAMGLDVFTISKLAHHRNITTTLRHYSVFDADSVFGGKDSKVRLSEINSLLEVQPANLSVVQPLNVRKVRGQ